MKNKIKHSPNQSPKQWPVNDSHKFDHVDDKDAFKVNKALTRTRSHMNTFVN